MAGPNLNEQEFRLRADEALTRLYNSLAKASDQHEFEVDSGGSVTVEFEAPPAKFVVSPNEPVRQIWVSARSKSYKLSWVPEKHSFVLAETGQTLQELVGSALSQQLGEEILL